MQRHGADATRSVLRRVERVSGAAQLRRARARRAGGRFLRTLKNVYSGIFAQYANFGWSPSDQIRRCERPTIDRWMIVDSLRVERPSTTPQAYDATTARATIIEFVDDDLANWYVRLNRVALLRHEARTIARRSRRCTKCSCPFAGCSRRSRRSSRTGFIASSPASRCTSRRSSREGAEPATRRSTRR
jgi:isoleucyl-tRNA synthetase